MPWTREKAHPEITDLAVNIRSSGNFFPLLKLFGVSMRLKPVMVVPIGVSVTVIALAFLYLHVESLVRNRLEYQSWIPFVIGFALALAVGLWPVTRFCSARSRLIVRSLVFTLCLAPIPYGPEGTLVPALLAMIFPPLIMLFLSPVGPLLTFLAVLGIVASTLTT